MKNALLSFLMFLCAVQFHAQTYNLTGTVAVPGKEKPEDATVSLIKKKDSSVVTYASPSASGRFMLKTGTIAEPSFLRIDKDGYKTATRALERIDNHQDVGIIKLQKDTVTTIREVKISAAPVKIKKDTIEFNTSKIKLRPDSKIEDLLKEIPGVQISNDNEITINGKKADKILINGKPFFDKDGKIALKNIPSDLIKSIQFTTTKTREEEMTGKAPKSNNATINFKIDEAKNQGLMARLTAGYGTSKRYEASGLLSYFKKDTKISVFASSNNVNTTGFSNDEVFGSMGGGRNAWGLTERPSNGIQKYSSLGINYSDTFGKKVDLENFGVLYTNSNIDTRSNGRSSVLLPVSVLTTSSEQAGNIDVSSLSNEFMVKIKADSLTSASVGMTLSRNKRKSWHNSLSSTFRDGELAYTGGSRSFGESATDAFRPEFNVTRKFSKKGRSVYLSSRSEISQDNSQSVNISDSQFFLGNAAADNRNQRNTQKELDNMFRFSAKYIEPITDSLSLEVGVSHYHENIRNSRNIADLDASGTYGSVNSSFSYDMTQVKNEWAPGFEIALNKRKFRAWLGADFNFDQMNVESKYGGNIFNLTQNYLLPNIFSGFYKRSPTSDFQATGAVNFTIPTALQLTPYKDEFDPFSTVTGNPNLGRTWIYDANVYYNKRNIAKKSFYYTHLTFEYKNGDVVLSSDYDPSGKRHSTYMNVDGNRNGRMSFGYNKTYSWKKATFSFRPSFSTTYSFNQGFVNGEQFSGSSLGFGPNLQLTYEVKDRIVLRPTVNLNFNKTVYENYSIGSANTSFKIFKVELTNYFMNTNLFFGNDFTFQTYGSDQWKDDTQFYLWNSSVGYTFAKKQFTAKLAVYDLLNQNKGIRNSISETGYTYSEELVLKRYFMLSLSMKVNKIGGKKLRGSSISAPPPPPVGL